MKLIPFDAQDEKTFRYLSEDELPPTMQYLLDVPTHLQLTVDRYGRDLYVSRTEAREITNRLKKRARFA